MCTATVEEKENMYRNSRFAYAGLLFLATLILFTFVSDDAEADTIDVDSLGGADYTNLSQAVSNANSGDTINVAARTYTDTVLVNKQLTILGSNEGSGKDAGNIFGSAGDLVARYKFDETSGTDASCSLSDGNCDDLEGDVEGASWSTGIWANGLDFDGNNDYVTVDDDSALDITEFLTISAWINLDDNEGTQFIVDKHTADLGYYLAIAEDGDGNEGKLNFAFGWATGSWAQCHSELIQSMLSCFRVK